MPTTPSTTAASPMHLVHGDVRPARVAISSSGQVRLTDLGASRVVSFVRATGPAPGVKPLHAAPELLTGATPTCAATCSRWAFCCGSWSATSRCFPASPACANRRSCVRRGCAPTCRPPWTGSSCSCSSATPPAGVPPPRRSAGRCRRWCRSPDDAERALASIIRDGIPARRTFHRLPTRRAARARGGPGACLPGDRALCDRVAAASHRPRRPGAGGAAAPAG